MTATANSLELGIEVPVSQIDRELRRLWEQDDARTNASLMNLVVYSEKHGSLVENSEIIRDLTRDHSCRAILVEIDRDCPEPGLRAWITAHCHLSHGMKSICCEQIAFHLTGRVTGRFRNTVFAHLNSDLPLVFWWQGELSPVFTERLVSVMDRLIIDSSSWKDPAARFAQLCEAMQANGELVLQDLAWTRSWQFRVGIAGLFDDPVARQSLPEIDGVEITHHPAHRNSALQIAAWLAVQAGWSDSPDGRGFLSESGTAISLDLKADPASEALGALILRSPSCIVSVVRDAGADHVLRAIKSPGHKASSLAPADPRAPEELVAMQLSRGGRNSLYQKILPHFLAMLGRDSHPAPPQA
jgi:glucose-6-phosphate dehydrogenase assembly protein OpcA